MFIVDSNKCTGCGACIDICPQGAISIRNNIAVIDHRICIQCGSCAEICPAGAIGMIEPAYAQPSRKGGENMPFGRGWFGRGWGGGWGRGNPYPYCRFYPWLPRWWWATPHAARYAATIPYMGYGYPYYGVSPYMVGVPYYPYGYLRW